MGAQSTRAGADRASRGDRRRVRVRTQPRGSTASPPGGWWTATRPLLVDPVRARPPPRGSSVDPAPGNDQDPRIPPPISGDDPGPAVLIPAVLIPAVLIPAVLIPAVSVPRPDPARRSGVEIPPYPICPACPRRPEGLFSAPGFAPAPKPRRAAPV